MNDGRVAHSCWRRRARGFMLLEVLACLAVMMLLLGTVFGTVMSLRLGLTRKAAREQQWQQWLQASDALRDDLRLARHVEWLAPDDGEPSLCVTRRDGTAVEYQGAQRALWRFVTRDRKLVQQRPFAVEVALRRLQRCSSGAAKAWELATVEKGRPVDVSGPVFFLLSAELRSAGAAPRAVVVGATTRLEP